MVKLKQILRATPMKIHRNSARCVARITSAEVFLDDNGAFKFMQGHVVDPPAPGPWPGSRGPYTVIAKLYMSETKEAVENPKVFIWCDCEYFKFHCETSLAIRGSSAIINSNGALPKVTNPGGRPQVCKHCLAFLRKAQMRKQFLTSKTNQAQKDARLSTALSKATPPPKTNQFKLKSKFPGVLKVNKTRSQVEAEKLSAKMARQAAAKPATKSTPVTINLRGHR